MNNREIAALLRKTAHELPFDTPGTRRTWQIPGLELKITCECTRAALLSVAKKFEKGRRPPRMNQINRASTNRPGKPSMRTFLHFWKDGEYDNAREYLRLYDRDQWPREAVDIINEAERA